ncbi:MAG: CapA family protein [Candidatus Aminicenantes bacterium]|nr:CapA family protein [Candidatus Aminicenantes bacterium]
MILTGDSIITRRLSVYVESEFLKLIELVRSADVAFTNLEVLFHDYEPYPMHESGGTYLRAEPVLAKELVWAGFDMVSRANNHAGDFGVLGMELTTKYVEQAGLVHAGVGRSLAEAREARFLETAKARIALISCASTFPDHVRASKSRDDIPPRPGLNPLRFITTYVVTTEQMDYLRGLMQQWGLILPKDSDQLIFLRQRFVKGEIPEIRTSLHPDDLAEITAVIRNASGLADLTIVSVHSHEQGKDRFLPAAFLVDFAHAAIEAGADVVVNHGPHILKGIEIYKGKPIFYSLGNFIFQNETPLRLPQENYESYRLGEDKHVADFNEARYSSDRRGFPSQPEYWESVVACLKWQGKDLQEVKLVPISLGFGKPRWIRGRPVLADPILSRQIIEGLKKLSQPFGVMIEFKEKENAGYIVLPSK